MSRLDVALVERHLARSRTHASRLISEGRVSVNGSVVGRAAADIAAADNVVLATSSVDWVSRAGHKLAGALHLFTDVQVQGRTCLDAGASTGGFTDVLLRRGAARVAAVDVGHGQLVDQLRHDPRVDVYEGLNVRELQPAMIGGPVDLTVGDLSFISLRLVMAPLAAATAHDGDLVLMVKPQFEVGRARLGKGGVVTREEDRRDAINGVIEAARDAGLYVAGQATSPLPGRDGNLEYFLWLRHCADA